MCIPVPLGTGIHNETMSRSNDDEPPQSWGEWFKDKVNPWKKEQEARQERNEHRDTNQRVVNTKATLSDLKKMRRLKGMQAEKLKKRALEADAQGNFREARRCEDEYKFVHKEMLQVDGLIRNLQGASSTLDSTALNVRGFEAMRDAQQGMDAVTQQVKAQDVDRVMGRMQRNVDHGREISRAMTQQVDWGIDDVGDYDDVYNQGDSDLLSQWRSEIQVNDLPSAPHRSVQNDNNVGTLDGDTSPSSVPQKRRH